MRGPRRPVAKRTHRARRKRRQESGPERHVGRETAILDTPATPRSRVRPSGAPALDPASRELASHGATSRGAAPHDIVRVENLRVAIRLQGKPGQENHGELEVVRGASFRIPAGRTVALVGESGSGKSITAQALLGILPGVGRVSGGRILWQERPEDEPLDLAPLADDSSTRLKLRGGKMSIIFQEPMTSLSPLHTIGNQIEEALLLHRDVSEDEARATVVSMLDLVGFPKPDAAYSMYPMELSGGLRQRAVIAMALICHPSLVIADEPTTALDVSMQAKILALLKELQGRLGMAVLMITHDLGVVANMADEVVVMYHGQVMEAGTVEDIFRDPQHEYLKALLAAVPDLSMPYDEKLQALRDIETVIPRAMRGDAERRVAQIGDRNPILRVEGLTKTFVTKKRGNFFSKRTYVHAVDDVNFVVKRGECFGLVGESGCGKTTTLKMIVNAITPSAGRIAFHDGQGETEIGTLRGRELKRFRRRIQMIFQDPFSSLSPRQTVLNCLREPMEVHGIGTSAEQREYAEELMRLVGLQPSYLGRYPHSFSGGQRQRIGIARALALRPDLLVCDEPVSALDVSVQAQVLNLLKELQRELGLTYIFISHNLAVVRYIADRIGVMYRGQLVEVAEKRELFERPAHPYTRALLEVVPHADLDHPLDFDRINRDMEGQERPWEAVFQPERHDDVIASDGGMEMVYLSESHRVRARRGTQPDDIIALARAAEAERMERAA